jgi:RNA polymerase sigma factor (sigma-70 family)
MQYSSESQLSRDFARLAAGDRSAVSTVFHELWPKVQRFCQGLLGNAHDADDAAQRTLEKIFTQATDFDQSRSVSAWALTIAVWECRTIRRQTTRRRADPIPTELPHEQPSPEQAVEHAQLMNALHAALVELSETDQAVLQSVLAADDSSAKSASSAFRKQKQRALARLKQAFWRHHET